MRRLLLVRHGQSRATVDGVVGGARGCRGLSDLGRSQAAGLAARWSAAIGPADRLVSSALPRARETAELLRAALGSPPVAVDAALNEIDPGEGDGLGWAEWERRYGWFDLAAEPDRPLSPGGESWAAFGARAGAALVRLAGMDGTTVAVCHGGVIERSVSLAFGFPPSTGPGALVVTPPPASVTEWRVEGDGAAPRWRLVRYGDTVVGTR